jgi:hypothetical protein
MFEISSLHEDPLQLINLSQCALSPALNGLDQISGSVDQVNC